MNTLKWLGIVLVLASGLALIRGLLGESLAGLAIFFVLAAAVVHFVLGGRNWMRAALAGFIAAVAYAGVTTLFAR